MKNYFTDSPTLEDAYKDLIDLLDKENKEKGIQVETYKKNTLKNLPRISLPSIDDRNFIECDSETYEIRGFNKNSEETGYRGYIFLYHYKDSGNTRYELYTISPEERSPYNYTIPFRNLTDKALPLLMSGEVLFSKPLLPISIEEAQTPEAQRIIKEYVSYGRLDIYWYEDLEDKYYKYITKEKESLFEVADWEVEENPEDFPVRYETNLSLKQDFPPSLLSRETGKEIKSTKDYVNAFEAFIGTKLDRRERIAVAELYNFVAPERFLDYATYEFIRTEDYSHLKEILSHYSDFGLSEKWEKEAALLYDTDRKNRRGVKNRRGIQGIYRTPEEYVLSKYLKIEFSTILSPISAKELSQGTGFPLSLISKAINFKVWDV